MVVASTRRSVYASGPGQGKKAGTYPPGGVQNIQDMQDMTRKLYLLIRAHHAMGDELHKKRQELNTLEHKIESLEQDVQRSRESIDELQRKIADILKINI